MIDENISENSFPTSISRPFLNPDTAPIHSTTQKPNLPARGTKSDGSQ